MASTTVTQVAPATARDGFDTRTQDLNGACTEKQEWVDKVGKVGGWRTGSKVYPVDSPAVLLAKSIARRKYEKLMEAAEKARYEYECAWGWDEEEE